MVEKEVLIRTKKKDEGTVGEGGLYMEFFFLCTCPPCLSMSLHDIVCLLMSVYHVHKDVDGLAPFGRTLPDLFLGSRFVG